MLGTFLFLSVLFSVMAIRIGVEIKAAKSGKRYTKIRH